MFLSNKYNSNKCYFQNANLSHIPFWFKIIQISLFSNFICDFLTWSSRSYMIWSLPTSSAFSYMLYHSLFQSLHSFLCSFQTSWSNLPCISVAWHLFCLYHEMVFPVITYYFHCSIVISSGRGPQPPWWGQIILPLIKTCLSTVEHPHC